MCDLLFYSSFYGLAWNDTHTANKCTCVAGLIYENVTFYVLQYINYAHVCSSIIAFGHSRFLAIDLIIHYGMTIFFPKVIMKALPAIVPDLFQQVLSALHIHGIHDHVRSQLSFLALLIYQSSVRP